MTKEQKEKALAFLKDMQECTYDGVEEIRTAIECLEQPTSDDCMSRAELKKWLDMNFSFGGALRKLEMFDRIDKELPPVTPTQSWIPVNEKLPEEYGEYMITWTTSSVEGGKHKFVGTSEYEVTSEYDHKNNRFKGNWLLEEYIKIHYPNVQVIAWQPKPQPYEEK